MKKIRIRKMCVFAISIKSDHPKYQQDLKKLGGGESHR
jgi:hypothetical protein